jgi:hypothetical protein
MIHSPPQERAIPVICLAGHLALPGTEPIPLKPELVAPTRLSLKHTRSRVLAEPFNNNKKTLAWSTIVALLRANLQGTAKTGESCRKQCYTNRLA